MGAVGRKEQIIAALDIALAAPGYHLRRVRSRSGQRLSRARWRCRFLLGVRALVSNQVRVQSSAGRTEGECPRPISCWSVPARGHASNCLASSRHPACACPVVASPRRTGPTPRRRQRAIEPAIAAAMRRIERGLGSSQGPQKRAIRGRIVAGVEWLGGRVKTRFAPFEAGWRGCARAPAACRGGRVPPQFCRLKTAESCADEAKTLVFSGSDLC